ncbi:VIT1/CCC1 transporter family protein [Gallaecimonas mangrovi]|uniref:VIT1/CCC1 transporter family protein n=1 Tax=Gallaecimonas mangrovi TaxID=2291597 RepID=UPI000E207411|nr:VIT1/CCC1 family protein [Gallaecimonas mangrovi]
MAVSEQIKAKALVQQQNEINDFAIYTLLARNTADVHNAKLLRKIAAEEKNHYHFCQSITGKDCTPSRYLVMFYLLLIKLLGSTFAAKYMESREIDAEAFYLELEAQYPQARRIYEQETRHENRLISMLHDSKLDYAGAIVLGMNDALVELTGTLSGVALAFNKTATVGVTGLIMGIAASLSMAGSAYLESKESNDTNIKPRIYALNTGGAYVVTTLFLVMPFFLFHSMWLALAVMFAFAALAIWLYSFYISVAKEAPFRSRFVSMIMLTFGVAVISFAIGFVARRFIGIDI